MKKVLVLGVVIATLLSGCGRIDRELSSLTGKPSEVCYDNVVYLQFTSGVTPKLTTDGFITKCEK